MLPSPAPLPRPVLRPALSRIAAILVAAAPLAPAQDAAREPPAVRSPGRASGGEADGETARRAGFVRTVWYEHGGEDGLPRSNSRFRVNAPETTLHPRYGGRVEARGNGLLAIPMQADPRAIEGAELYAEIWGGHPGTAGKQVTVNGRSTYPLPPAGVADGNCAHEYPRIRLARSDLVRGWNAFQFACDRGTAGWGHFIVDEAALRVMLPRDHPDIARRELSGLSAEPTARAVRGSESLRLGLRLRGLPGGIEIARVDWIARYRSYDEDGDARRRDEHGFTKDREPVAIAGSARAAPWRCIWDLGLIPAQENVAVRAVVHFDTPNGLSYETAPLRGLEVPQRPGRVVRLLGARELPRPFWSRAGRPLSCTIELPAEPGRIERAELHMVIWDGGRGSVEHPVRLNGHPVPVAGAGHHDVLYRRVRIDPAFLRRGANRVEVLSDTEHHGIEVLLPGPALVVRLWRGGAGADGPESDG